MCTLPSPKAAQKIQKDGCAEAIPSGAQDAPQPCVSPLAIQTYRGASFAPGGCRSRSGICVGPRSGTSHSMMCNIVPQTHPVVEELWEED